ncbi:hypothetical protein [Amycolatopsis sp. FDAARGOS 1241]|uniref:hypothetical protein n=1 Tax=Amycolatopsis sp. FDAARGOS 1241 TaxID=2778070 RepID=UPI001951E851|nr:hypothetical protein [Amycolatopsis sp. FDAARGOS 1241]QRP42631.1 hypothetical protein I6J71_24300 [Amycolatopsis sp. FDAARGOS 1241]
MRQRVDQSTLLPTAISPPQPAAQLRSAQPVFRVRLGVPGLVFALAEPPLLRLVPVHWLARLSVGSLVVFGIALLGDVARPGTTAFPSRPTRPSPGLSASCCGGHSVGEGGPQYSWRW